MNITKDMLLKEIEVLQKASALHANYSISQYKTVLETLDNLEEKVKERTKDIEILLSLFDVSDSVLFKWDSLFNVLYVSKGASILFGYTKDEFLNNEINFLDCIHKDDRQMFIDSFNSTKKNFKNHNYRIITKDNKIKWVIDNIMILKEENLYIGYISDISEQKNKDEQLFMQSKMASMGEMIGNIAHQWRQPLSVISTNATGLMFQKDMNILDDDKVYSACEKINENAQYLSQTIDDFKNFIKGDRSKSKFLVKDLFTKLEHLVLPIIKTHNIELHINYDQTLELTSYFNELLQVFINLVNNSKDIINEQEIEHKYIFIDVSSNSENIFFDIYDSGNGIDKEIINKIFEPYFTTKHQSTGTGLGLYMSRNIIVDGCEGNIEVSNKNYMYNNISLCGANFKITIPKNNI